MIMTFIQTIGKDKITYDFKYVYENYICDTCKIPKVSFMIYFADDSYDDFFDFKIAPLDEFTVKITDMFLDTRMRFKGKGIPETMILEVQRLFPDRQIISSTNKNEFSRVCNEWRSVPGSRVWGRLVEKGLASYNNFEDIYYLNKPN